MRGKKIVTDGSSHVPTQEGKEKRKKTLPDVWPPDPPNPAD
ncbi:MAG: hypothetical protein NWE95_02260 [Candidatus Bathyarchaeota archaeon]|nr:hypothetical protein [Candidatus Bathyarchaeota archaeon]